MAAVQCISSPERALAPVNDGLPDLDGLRLRIFDRIEPGFGVVPIVGNDVGSHMLQPGEVAVYDENWRINLMNAENEMTAGLYCMERQRPGGGMMPETFARVMLEGHSVRMVIERQVVMVFRHPRSPDCWAYSELRSRLHRSGVRMTSRTEGPIYAWAMPEMLLGPIVGLYRPAPIRSAH